MRACWECTDAFLYMLRAWYFTVLCEMESSSSMWRALWPRASRMSISRSRCVSCTSSASYVATEKTAVKPSGEVDLSNLADGTYTGTGAGMGGDINVTIEISGGTISVADISPNNETQGIGGYEAIEDGTYAAQVEAAQSADIDGVAGATVTSKAIEQAVKAALKQAAK